MELWPGAQQKTDAPEAVGAADGNRAKATPGVPATAGATATAAAKGVLRHAGGKATAAAATGGEVGGGGGAAAKGVPVTGSRAAPPTKSPSKTGNTRGTPGSTPGPKIGRGAKGASATEEKLGANTRGTPGSTPGPKKGKGAVGSSGVPAAVDGSPDVNTRGTPGSTPGAKGRKGKAFTGTGAGMDTDRAGARVGEIRQRKRDRERDVGGGDAGGAQGADGSQPMTGRSRLVPGWDERLQPGWHELNESGARVAKRRRVEREEEEAGAMKVVWKRVGRQWKPFWVGPR